MGGGRGPGPSIGGWWLDVLEFGVHVASRPDVAVIAQSLQGLFVNSPIVCSGPQSFRFLPHRDDLL